MRTFVFSKSVLIGGVIAGLASVAFIQGCQKKSSSSSTTACSTTVTSLQSGICAAQTAMAVAPHFVDSNPTAFNLMPRLFRYADNSIEQLLMPAAFATSGPSLSAFWTTSTAVRSLYDGSTFESPQNWMGEEMDSNFVNSNNAPTTPFGRAAMDQFMACVLGSVTSEMWSSSIDTDNLLKVGTYSTTQAIDFSTASSGTFMGCTVPSTAKQNIVSMGSIASGTPILTVTAVTGSTYTKAYAMNGGNTYYLKLDPTNHIMNLGEVDELTGLQHGWGVERQLLSVNSGVVDFEYTSQSYCGGGATKCTDAASAEGGNLLDSLEMYRFHVDTSTNVAYVFGASTQYDDALASGDGSSNASESFMRYAMAGKPNSLNSISISMTEAGMSQGLSFIAVGASAQNYGDGCISASTGSESNDGSLSCDLSASAIDITNSGSSGATSTSGVAEATIIAHASSSSTYASSVYTVDGNTAINWSTFDTNTSTGMFGVPSTTN